MMRSRSGASATLGMMFAAFLASPFAFGDEPKAAPKDSVAAIDADFRRDSLKLEKTRLERLARLAASLTGSESDRAYEIFFRAAISTDLYVEAEPTAEAVMKSATASSQVVMLARLVNVIAEAKRGDFPESLKDLVASLKEGSEGRKAALPSALKVTLADAFIQKLVQGGQYDLAGQVVAALQQKTDDAAVKDLAAQWTKQINLVGKPAPAIEGKDIDGKPYRLSDAKGDVVLVVFWATWCLANAQEVAAFDEAYDAYRAKGFRIVGVNVDALQENGGSAEAVLPGVKRFLIDSNVRWPNLIDQPGKGEIASSFGVKDLPSNVLIGRDGKVVQLNLIRANLDEAIARELAR